VDKINILLVDNNPTKLLTYEAMLAELGENVITAKSGDEALEHLLKTEVAIVLSDVKMPDIDGFELANMIHSHRRHIDTAIILISAALVTDQDRLKGYERGAVDYVSVPIVPELLRARVKVFAELYRRRQESEKLHAEMRRLSGVMIELQDEERRRIARELHDSLGQQLTVAKIAVDGIKSPESTKQAQEAGELIDEALRQVRSISYLLHPPLLDEVGLEFALQWYLQGLSKRSRIETSLVLDPPAFPRLPPKCENALYRIIQEAVTNSFRHSGAHKISISLKNSNGKVWLAVRDNGKGISKEIAAFRRGSVGVGIEGMRQRITELGGELKLSNANPGTLVEVAIPIKVVEPDRFGGHPIGCA
jgi:signal transduction histidine kinase